MRSIWSGTISFGLVSVGLRMFPATESKELRFHFLDKRDLSPVGRKLPEPESEEEGEVVDLMTALRESVECTKRQRKRRTSKKPARKAS